MPAPLPDPGFWAGRRVLLTGHSGFKGGWAALWLHRLGARVTGLGLPAGTPSLCALAGVERWIDARLVDLRDGAAIAALLREVRPEIVLHLAAQPLVRQALRDPVETFSVNVLGTVTLLAALRHVPPPRAVLVVTSDKVYGALDGAPRAHRETDRLGGFDPYGASKAACEIATLAMARNFLMPDGCAVGTARGGNVIGGGDFAPDRLIPDLVRAVRAGILPTLRHPGATRPWQHVLDCLCGYLLYAEALAQRRPVPHTLNFGPDPAAPVTVGQLAGALLTALGRPSLWRDGPAEGREAATLAIDPALARSSLGWRDRITGTALVAATAGWYRAWMEGQDMHEVTRGQIAAYEATP